MAQLHDIAPNSAENSPRMGGGGGGGGGSGAVPPPSVVAMDTSAASMLQYMPTDHPIDVEARQIWPEEVFERVLQNEAFHAAQDFFALLHEPLVLRLLVEYLVHKRISAGNRAMLTSEEHAQYVFHAFACEPLALEIVTYLGNDKMIYLFGTKFPSLGIPLSIIRSSAEVLGRLLRMCLRTQAGSLNETGVPLANAAFGTITADRERNSTTFSNFRFNAVFDLALPRVPVIGQYVLLILSHSRQYDRDNKHHEAIELRRSSSEACMAAALRRSSGDAELPPPVPNTLYENSCVSLRKALSEALKWGHWPVAPMTMPASNEVAVHGAAPRDQEQVARVAHVREHCHTLLDLLRDTEDGQLTRFYEEVVEASNFNLAEVMHMKI
jgi:hypothetical protein